MLPLVLFPVGFCATLYHQFRGGSAPKQIPTTIRIMLEKDMIPKLGLSECFERACAFMRSRFAELDESVSLALYGLFKQAKEGSCEIISEGQTAQERAKLKAWKEYSGMAQNEAMIRYLELVSFHFSDFVPQLEKNEPERQISTGKMSILNTKKELQEEMSQKYLMSLSEEDRKVSKAYQVLRQSTEVEHISPFFNEGVLTAESKDAVGDTPLHICCDAGNLEGVKYLIEVHNADVMARNLDQENPILNAALVEAKDIVRYLLEKRGKAQTMLTDKSGDSAVTVMRDHGWNDLLEEFKLLE